MCLDDQAAVCPLDRVNRRFKAPHPNALWVFEFTYVVTWSGFVYVAFVIHVFARRIVGWRGSQPFATAPRDRRINIRAERWVAFYETLRVETFPRCKWCAGGTVGHPAPYWRCLPPGWTPTHWREDGGSDAAVDVGTSV